MAPSDFARLTLLMTRTRGRSTLKIGLIDGPVFLSHPDLAGENLREIAGDRGSACAEADSMACLHGTFIAGMLSAKRGTVAPAICPDCTLLVRPVFADGKTGIERMPSATPQALASAIVECVEAGAHVLNLSLGLAQASTRAEAVLDEALDHALRRDVIVVAAAGNQGTIGSSTITRHPWVIPVVACDLQGRPVDQSNLCRSVALQGLCAPGDSISSLTPNAPQIIMGGTSVAVPFVTGTVALLWSAFPFASAADIKQAVTRHSGSRRATVVPPLLDAEAAYQSLLMTHARST